MPAKTKKTAKKKVESEPGAPRAILKPEMVIRIHSKSMCDVRVIRRWAEGHIVRPSTALRIERASRELGIPLLA